MPRPKRPCDCCGRPPGTYEEREELHRKPVIGTVPLGPLVKCKECGQRVCPDCYEESDCCEFGQTGDPRPMRGPEVRKIAKSAPTLFPEE